MEYIIILITIIFIMLILAVACKINLKQVKDMAENTELDNIAKKVPENIELCKWYLKKLDNEKVKIEENKESDTCLYIAISNKIIIGNLKESYSRIQTVAHECLHSIQYRRILIFNFIFSNLYLVYFVLISALAIFKILPYKMMFLVILLLLSYTYYFVRSYLENDAMTKARFLAKEYLEENKIIEKQEIDKLINEYDKLNFIGIKLTDYMLMLKTLTKVVIFALICLI